MARPITIDDAALVEGAAITITFRSRSGSAPRSWRGTVVSIGDWSAELRGVRGGKTSLGENANGLGLFMVGTGARSSWVEAVAVAA